MDNNKKKPKEPVQQEPVEMPTNDYPDSLADNTDNTLRDIWGELWGVEE